MHTRTDEINGNCDFNFNFNIFFCVYNLEHYENHIKNHKVLKINKATEFVD